eukprot:1681192-Amphidinium_carterae.2
MALQEATSARDRDKANHVQQTSQQDALLRAELQSVKVAPLAIHSSRLSPAVVQNPKESNT